MKKIALFILYIYFPVNLMAQTPITVNELFDRAATINYADIPTSIEIDFHDGSMPPVAGDDNLLGSSGYDYHARAFKVNLPDNETLRISYGSTYNGNVDFYKKDNDTYSRVNVRHFLNSSQIEDAGEYYIILAVEYGYDFEKITLTFDFPFHFYTVAELYEAAIAISDFPFNKSEKLDENNSFIVIGGTDGIGEYPHTSYLTCAYRFSLDAGESVFLSHSIEEVSNSHVYVFAENAGQFKLIQRYNNRINKTLFAPSDPGNILIITTVTISNYPRNYSYSFEVTEGTGPVISLENCVKDAEKIEALPYSLRNVPGNELSSSFMKINGSYYYGKAFSLHIEKGKAIQADFISEEINADFNIYRKMGNWLVQQNAYYDYNILGYRPLIDDEYIILLYAKKPLETLSFTLNVAETEVPNEMTELFESAVPLSYDDMPFTISSTLGLPPSKLVAATNSYDNAWINAQAFKVTMKANEKIRINMTGAGLKIFLKEYDMYNQATYKQTSYYSDNILYADKDDDYYIVVSSDIKNGNVDFSLKVDRITGLCSPDDVLDNAKPLSALPCKMSGLLNEQSNMVDNGFYLYYATAYRLSLKAGTAAKIGERGYNHNATITVYQKIDNEYQLVPVYSQYSYYELPMLIFAEKSGDYYIVISSGGLKNSEYDLKITEISIPITYKELIDATTNVTTFPFIGSGTLNNEHATLVKGDWYFGGESCYFSNAYKLSLESGTLLTYNLTSDEVEKRLYIYDSQTYNWVHTNNAGQGSYLVTKSGNYHVVVTTKNGLDEGDYTLKMKLLSEISTEIETLLENAQPISVPTSLADVLGGDSEPCVADNYLIWGGYDNHYYAKTYRFHLDKGESVQIKAASDFLYPGMSLARKNLQGKFVNLVSMTTGSLKYQAKESGDYYLTVASPYSRPLTSGDFTLTIQPFSYSTLDDLLANAGESFFDENLSCSVSGSLEEAPLILEKGQTKYNDRYYFAQAYKIKLEEGIHLMTYIQSANYPPYIRLFKKENNEYKLINKDYNLSYPFLVDETDEYYIVIYAYENYEKTDFTLYLKTFMPVTLNDLFADASEFTFPGSVSGTFERGKSPYLFSDGYSFVQAYKMNISAKTNIVAALSSSIDAGSFMIYKKNGNNYEMVSYYTSYYLKELEPGEYYFIVYGPVYTDSHYVLRVDGITGQDSLESLFRNAQTVNGQTDLSYIHSCDFIKHSAPVIEFEKQTCKARAFKLENFSSIQHQIEFACNEYGSYFLCLYEKDGNEYTMIDKVHDWGDYLSSTFTPSPGKEYFVLLAVELYGTHNNSYTLKITNIRVSESKILDMKLEGGHYIRIPSTFTEEDIKELLVNKKIIPKVSHNEITPTIRNSVSCWTVNPTLTQATGLFEAPEGYRFSDGIGAIVVDFNSPLSKVSGIKMAIKNATIRTNESKQLTVTVEPSDAAEKSVIWEVTNPQIAHVDIFTGLVTGITPGITFIRAKSLENDVYSDFCIVTVESIPVNGISLNKTAATVVVNKSEQLIATVTPDNAYYTGLTWSSSDPSVAVVDESGQITGISEGIAIISVTTDDGQYTATCEVTIVSETTGADIEDSKPLLVYPNPARDIVHISGLEGGEILHIMDMTGKKISAYRVKQETEVINVSHLPQGMYLLCVMKGNTKRVLKLVVVD